MLFNSIDFAIFLPISFLFYWFLTSRKLRLQNAFIVFASYVFYGWWDFRFLALILLSTTIDFSVGILINRENIKIKNKYLLYFSIIINIGLLAFFKYYNFFLDNFIAAFTLFGAKPNPLYLKIILPVGISFYTFQTLSYTIDIYRKKIYPTNDFIAFAAYVSFFPQLVAGPIERATNLLPQFYKKRKFNYEKAINGLKQILWGLFKKMVIADNCAQHANLIFNNYNNYSGSTLLLGSLFFTFQIYGDFSGYSDIAIGTARLFGFDLKRNFAFPYFSRDIAEFWRRWHISLSSWFRDYVYIPLGGSRVSTFYKVRNTFIIFLLSGFWHGANWTFIVWGALHATFFLPLLLLKINRQHLGAVAPNRYLPSIKEFLQITITFSMTVLAWIIFRAENLKHAFSYLSNIFSISIFTHPSFPGIDDAKLTAKMVIIFMFVEWFGRKDQYSIETILNKYSKPFRWSVYYLIIIIIFHFSGKPQDFIYFQF